MTQFNRGLKGLRKEHFSESDIFHLHVKYHNYHANMHDNVIYFKPNNTTPYVQINGVELTLSALIGMGLYQGVIDASTNPNYPAANEGEYWRVSVAGLIGGGAGTAVEVGDEIIAIATNVGGTEAAVGTSFMIIQKNMIPCTVAVLRTGTDDSAFVTANCLADQLNGGSSAFGAATIMSLSGGTTQQLLLSNSIAEYGATINSIGLTTGKALQITATVNSASVQVINVDISPVAALTGSEAVIGCDIAVQGNGADANGTSWTCYNAKIEGIISGQADLSGYTVDMVGKLDTADTHNGLVISFGQTMINSGATVYGTRISTGSFTHTLGNWYGHYINQTYTTVAGVSVAIGIDSVLSSMTTKAIEITASSATTTAVLINTMKLTQTMSGASGVNMAEVAQFIFESNVQVGNWANAVTAKMDFKTGGYMTGMAGVVCAELDLPVTATASGTYTCFEAEINYPAAQGVPVSAMAVNVWGAGVTSFDTNGLLFDINGVTEGAGNFLDAIADHAATHTIKLRIGGVNYYLLATDSLV